MKAEIVYLSLGSNMGNSIEILIQAILALNKAGLKVTEVSSIYLSEPVGLIEQPDFYNMVIVAETLFSPQLVLKKCQEIEKHLGRVRNLRWGPRKIDIDILYYGARIINEKELEVPHPRLKERAFVLVPLKEIDLPLFQKLNIFMPSQNLFLNIEQANVKMMLKEHGFSIK
jgi:2-amino-4-hydroxy-6-hydroxymethyldihydropteridine diphosphokinase